MSILLETKLIFYITYQTLIVNRIINLIYIMINIGGLNEY